MWVRKFSKIYPGVSREEIWAAWSNVNQWAQWDEELEYCDMKKTFVEGGQFILKPVGGPKVKITLSEVVPNEKFTDYCKFFGATMYDAHELEEVAEGLRVTNTITVTGPLTFLWVNLIIKNVAKSVPIQTDSLVEFVRSRNG